MRNVFEFLPDPQDDNFIQNFEHAIHHLEEAVALIKGEWREQLSDIEWDTLLYGLLAVAFDNDMPVLVARIRSAKRNAFRYIIAPLPVQTAKAGLVMDKLGSTIGNLHDYELEMVARVGRAEIIVVKEDEIPEGVLPTVPDQQLPRADNLPGGRKLFEIYEDRKMEGVSIINYLEGRTGLGQMDFLALEPPGICVPVSAGEFDIVAELSHEDELLQSMFQRAFEGGRAGTRRPDEELYTGIVEMEDETFWNMSGEAFWDGALAALHEDLLIYKREEEGEEE